MEDVSLKFTISDNNGNYYFLMGNRLFLQLRGKPVRHIGTLYRGKNEKDIVLKKEVKPENLFRKTDSFGIPYDVLMRIDVLCIVYESENYWIKKDEALKGGSFLWFKTEGFERQYFIPRSCFLKK